MRLPALLLTSALLVAGCAQNPSLKSAPAANAVAATGEAVAAVDNVSGVRVTAIPRAWPGNVRISNAVTPVKVRIDNNSSNPVLIRYSEIMLVGPGGRTFAALPPHNIDASVYAPRLAPGYTPVTTPGFVGRGFDVAPLYGPLYPGLPTATGGFFYDPFYYSHFGDFWRTVELPTDRMLQQALPEGRVNAGGHVEGFVYFQRVDADVPRVRFRMDILNAERGREIGTIEIPFTVSS
jgi:hypothetical protein